MRAAELRFPNPSTSPSWHDLAVKVFNDQASRWDTQTCGGGLRSQIFKFNAGYNYKDTMSNGAFFQLAARLARYTKNQTYADWATKSYDWTRSVGLINDDYKVLDGAKVGGNCSALGRIQWTSTAGAFMYGSAVMSNLVRRSLLTLRRIMLTSTSQTQMPHGRLVRTSCFQQCPSSLQRTNIRMTTSLSLRLWLRRPVNQWRPAPPTFLTTKV